LTPIKFFLKTKKVSRGEYKSMAIFLVHLTLWQDIKKDNKNSILFLPPPPPLSDLITKKNMRGQIPPYIWQTPR
jgi:hypothetical protein